MNSTEVLVRRTHGAVTEAAVTGDIDLHTAPDVRRAALDLVEQGHQLLILDLSEVQFCDSAGLSTLIVIWHAARDAGGRLSLVGVPETLMGVLSLTGVDTIMAIHPTVQAALADIPGAGTP
ncbi:STAS domain-containing protein [Streptomyces marincola]|uniref:STAS domain-containing protein n=1 Tax=Streptomyces marincola TaxID=2878388 RepID=UPI001CF4820E|nr:STAS domain-containing protein [Streptomyces marincola]UCM91622.1 STAS domain-containing protein [Streptomyces marincola]